jgi:hypothetical protein
MPLVVPTTHSFASRSGAFPEARNRQNASRLLPRKRSRSLPVLSVHPVSLTTAQANALKASVDGTPLHRSLAACHDERN